MPRRRKQKGIVALVFTMTVLAIITIILLFTSEVITTDTKIFNNVRNNAEAYNAAMAGFDYALGYLNANPYAVVGSAAPVGLGFCASAATTYVLPSPGALSNGATYTMTYSCITAGNFTTFNLTAVGTSLDGTSTRTVRGTLKLYCGVGQPLISRGNVTLDQTATISNNSANGIKVIDSGATIDLNNSTSITSTLGGTCSAPYTSPASTTCLNARSSNATSPATTNLTSANMSDANYQTLYLGRLVTAFSTLATASYNLTCSAGGAKTFNQTTTIAANCTGGPGGSATLSGQTGKIIYMDMGGDNLTLTTTSGGTFTLGSAAAPTILVINNPGAINITTNAGTGSTMTINGNIYSNSTGPNMTISPGAGEVVTINGLVFSTDTVNVSGSASSAPTINGAVISGNSNIQNVSVISYNPTYIGNTLNGYCGGAYGIVPGSWRDF